MLKKLFKPISIGGASALLAVTSFLSYAIGLLRDRIIAVYFGTSSATDTYNASFLIPDLIFNLIIAGALAAAFLPVFTEYLVKDKKEAFKIANTVLTGSTMLIAFLAILAFIFMGQIIPFIFSSATPVEQQDIIHMTRIMLSGAIIFAISNTLGNILMTYKHFMSYAISPILYNLGIILGVVFLQKSMGIYAAAAGILIGAIFHCAIRVADAFATGYKFRPQLNIFHPGFKKIIKLMIPSSINLLAGQINLYIFAVVGIQLITGGLAAFNFARNIQSFAVSLFGISFATAVFPHLSSTASTHDQQGYTDHIQKTIQRILFFTIPATIGLMLLSTPIVDLVLGGGEFQKESIRLTSLILFYFAISIPFESLAHIFARGFYARQNTITPTIISVLRVAIVSCITIFVAPKFGIEWFSIGFTVGFMIYIAIIAILLSKYLKGFNFKNFFISFSKTIIAAGIMAVVILLTQPLETMTAVKLSHVLRIGIGAGTFFIMAFLLKAPEIDSTKYILKRLFTKKPV